MNKALNCRLVEYKRQDVYDVEGFDIIQDGQTLFWISRTEFEREYLPIKESTPFLVSPEDVENLIAERICTSIHPKMQSVEICHKNGFKSYGLATGRQDTPEDEIKENANHQATASLYFLLGYMLLWAENGLNYSPEIKSGAQQFEEGCR